jgi:bacterioferritin-associated ferredoxin
MRSTTLTGLTVTVVVALTGCGGSDVATCEQAAREIVERSVAGEDVQVEQLRDRLPECRGVSDEEMTEIVERIGEQFGQMFGTPTP